MADRIRCETCGLRTDDARHWRACVPKKSWPAWMTDPAARDVMLAVHEALDEAEPAVVSESTESTALPAVALPPVAPVAHAPAFRVAGVLVSPDPQPAPTPKDSDHGGCCGHVRGVHVLADGMFAGSAALCMGCPDGQDEHAFRPVNQLPPPPPPPDLTGFLPCGCGFMAKNAKALALHRLKSRLHRAA